MSTSDGASDLHPDGGNDAGDDVADGGTNGADGGLAPARIVSAGVLDANGNASLSVLEIHLDDMPLVVGYVYTESYSQPGYVPLGNIVPGDGKFRFAAGAANANAEYILVVYVGSRTTYAGTLDSDGNASVSVPGLSVDDMPVVQGFVQTNAYAEPGYVPLGGIIPGDGLFRFSAGAGNANAPYVVVVSGIRSALYPDFLDASGNASVTVPELTLKDFPLIKNPDRTAG